MITRVLFTVIVMLLPLPGTAQNLIGRKAEEIKKYMAAGQKDFFVDETTVNKVYKYLKYVDAEETRTILYFLSDDSVCVWYKVIYDNDLLPSVTAALDSACRKVADTLWIEETGGHAYEKELDRQQWFFSVVTRPAQQDTVKTEAKKR